MSVTVKKSGPGIGGLRESLDRIRHSDVLVGIPAEKRQRKDDVINNASLLFVLSNGSPLQNIPATPIVEPSIELNQAIISPHLGAAAQGYMERDPERATLELELAGTIAANSAKRYFTDPRNGWPPNAPSTIQRKGSDRRNIDTGQLRRNITHVIREK